MNQPEIKDPAPIWPHPVEEGYTITYKFTSGDVDYFTITDAFNISSHRALSGLYIYDEWENRMTNDKLRTFIQAIMEELDAPEGKVHLSKIMQYLIWMKERIDWPIPTPDLFYKLSSVLVFDKNESPYYYDQHYCDKFKIPNWKANGVDTFFLSQQLKAFLPLPNIAPNVLKGLSMMVEKAAEVTDQSLQNHSQIESEIPLNRREQQEFVS